jgi:hypothetical protein
MRGKTIIGVFALLLLTGYAAWRWNYPYGARSCALPCTMGALEDYANHHGGWYPKGGTNPIHSLQALYPNLEPELAGISGDRNEVVRRLRVGLVLDESVSSWQYFPGLRRDDDPRTALIWEKRQGVAANGRRIDGHAVGFVDGSFRQVKSEGWGVFVSNQNALRGSILSTRTNKVNQR